MIISKNVYSYKGIILIFLLSFFSCITWGQIDPIDVDPNTETNSKCETLKAEVYSLSCSPDEDNPNGNVAILVTGGTPYPPPSDPYTTFDGNYVGNGIFEDDGLEPGTYTYTYWDSNGCDVDVTFTISGDECCDFEATAKVVSCAPDGNVIITVSGGSGPYTGDGNQVAKGIFEEEGLAAGTYTYTYTDQNGCKTTVTFTVEDECCDFMATAKVLTCAPDGNVIISVTGGSQPYYGDGNQVSPGIFEEEGLAEGTYTYTYTDRNGCETTVTFIVEDECCDFMATAKVVSCAQDGNVIITVSGGSQPYYGDGNQVSPGIFEEEGLDPGVYTYTYGDANGCETKVTFNIFEGPDASILSINGCSQVGNPNGNIAIQVTGGTPFSSPSDPYQTYDGNYVGNGIYEDDGLEPGKYTYTYWDSNGCETEVKFTIPEVLTAEASSTLGCGEIEVEVFGGTPPYTSNYNGQQNNTGLFEFSFVPNDYELSFTDAKGCVVTVVLEEPEIALCEDFTFSESLNATNPDPWNSEVFISGVHAKIGVVLWANQVHDVLRVEVNDVEILNLRAGANDCGPSNDCDGDDESNCAEFFVNCCDKVTFHVDGAICPTGHTVWNLDVTCLQTWGECFDIDESKINLGSPRNTTSSSLEEFANNSLQSIDRDLLSDGPQSGSVRIFPNPTSSKIHIDKSNHQYELQTVRIMDISGNVVKIENIQGLKDPQVDTSTLPVGLYILEIVDSKGKVFVEKLVKN